MKTYILTVSKVFPATHKRKLEPTFFHEKILNYINPLGIQLYEEFGPDLIQKIHTIRANYDLWSKRIKEVQEGKAILSLRYWSGKPYNSKQVEFCQFDKYSGVGVERVNMFYDETAIISTSYGFNKATVNWSELAKNDGLSLEDFKDWFKNYDLNKPMVIIQFTNFRY